MGKTNPKDRKLRSDIELFNICASLSQVGLQRQYICQRIITERNETHMKPIRIGYAPCKLGLDMRERNRAVSKGCEVFENRPSTR